MVYAYIRVSTVEQSGSSQRFEILNWAEKAKIKIDKWVEESVSGTIPPQKRKLGHVRKKMKPRDLLICTEISRLGRSVLMIMSILNECATGKVHLHTIKDNFDLNGDLNSKIIAFAFALAAEIERNLISQRTKEALRCRKASGMKLGRPAGARTDVKRSKLYSKRAQILRRLAAGESKRSIANLYHTDSKTLNRFLEKLEDE